MSPDHQAWFEKGDEDLWIIERSVGASHVPWAQMSFHAQQLAEKYLKGFLVLHDILPPKIHDLYRLLKLAEKHDPSLASFATDCSTLTELGLQSRYPGFAGAADETRARSAIEIAKRLRDAVRLKVPKDSL